MSLGTPVLTYLGYCDESVEAALYANRAVQDIQIKNEIHLRHRPTRICHITWYVLANLRTCQFQLADGDYNR